MWLLFIRQHVHNICTTYLYSSLTSTIHASISHTMLTILHDYVFSAYVTLALHIEIIIALSILLLQL